MPKRAFLRFLADHCESKEEAAQLLDLSDSRAERRELYVQQIEANQPSLLDLLQRFPSCHPPLAHLLSALPPLQPRMYSIVNSCLASPPSIHIAYTVVEHQSDRTDVPHNVGICSGWLTTELQRAGLLESRPRNWKWWPAPTRSEEPFSVHFFLRESSGFVLPHTFEDDKPIIMVGPGTGVVPFVCYLQHLRALMSLNPPPTEAERKTSGSKNRRWLFFGCRHPEKDFLYRDQLEKAEADKVLDRLVVAFSRYQAKDEATPTPGVEQEVKYVQHRIAEFGAELLELMNEGGRIFVCGDAKGMAKGVMSAFQDLIRDNLHLLPAEPSNAPSSNETPDQKAKTLFASWMRSNRFLLEAWA
jgi:sulfite reductase alpha subunit-like flavoprotein